MRRPSYLNIWGVADVGHLYKGLDAYRGALNG